MLQSNKYNTFAFHEMDDNDQTNDKILYEFFKGIDSTPKPSRYPSIPEAVLATIRENHPSSIVNIVEKVPDSLTYAIAAMKEAALGLANLKEASSLQRSLIAPLSEQESIEFALLRCGNARVLIMRMRMTEVLERYSENKNFPENAVILINDELGIMKKKTNAAIQTKKKKIIAATARRDINGGNKWRAIAALKSGEVQKNIAINLGIGDSWVSQIKKQYKKEREMIEKIKSGKSKEAIAVEFGISVEKVSEIIDDHRKNDR